METIKNNDQVWPYVLPSSLDAEKRGWIWSVPQSNVGLKILEEISVDKRTYQHGLVEKLPYSNKYLERKAGVQFCTSYSYGQTVAAITCSRVRAGNSFPTKEEVDAAVDLSGAASKSMGENFVSNRQAVYCSHKSLKQSKSCSWYITFDHHPSCPV